MSAREREYFTSGLRGHVHGTEERVRAALEEVVAQTGADEVLVTTSTYDREALRESFTRLAHLAGLRPGPPPRGEGRGGGA
jgi:alkanesulfonate monooxygenase SsuD/methylene tetrahydromethanopterin reductase-like flavin-dependent oxidoreductase (luciferase family)